MASISNKWIFHELSLENSRVGRFLSIFGSGPIIGRKRAAQTKAIKMAKKLIRIFCFHAHGIIIITNCVRIKTIRERDRLLASSTNYCVYRDIVIFNCKHNQFSTYNWAQRDISKILTVRMTLFFAAYSFAKSREFSFFLIFDPFKPGILFFCEFFLSLKYICCDLFRKS